MSDPIYHERPLSPLPPGEYVYYTVPPGFPPPPGAIPIVPPPPVWRTPSTRQGTTSIPPPPLSPGTTSSLQSEGVRPRERSSTRDNQPSVPQNHYAVPMHQGGYVYDPSYEYPVAPVARQNDPWIESYGTQVSSEQSSTDSMTSYGRESLPQTSSTYQSGSPIDDEDNRPQQYALCHHCAVCNRPRSKSYHRRHPLIPGEPPPATTCSRCMRIDTGQSRRHSDGKDRNRGRVSISGSSSDEGLGRRDTLRSETRVRIERRGTGSDGYDTHYIYRYSEPRERPRRHRRHRRHSSVKVAGRMVGQDEQLRTVSAETFSASQEQKVREIAQHLIQLQMNQPNNESRLSRAQEEDVRSIAWQTQQQVLSSSMKNRLSEAELQQVRQIAREQIQSYRAAEKKLEAKSEAFSHGYMVPVVEKTSVNEKKSRTSRSVPKSPSWEETKIQIRTASVSPERRKRGLAVSTLHSDYEQYDSIDSQPNQPKMPSKIYTRHQANDRSPPTSEAEEKLATRAKTFRQNLTSPMPAEERQYRRVRRYSTVTSSDSSPISTRQLSRGPTRPSSPRSTLPGREAHTTRPKQGLPYGHGNSYRYERGSTRIERHVRHRDRPNVSPPAGGRIQASPMKNLSSEERDHPVKAPVHVARVTRIRSHRDYNSPRRPTSPEATLQRRRAPHQEIVKVREITHHRDGSVSTDRHQAGASWHRPASRPVSPLPEQFVVTERRYQSPPRVSTHSHGRFVSNSRQSPDYQRDYNPAFGSAGHQGHVHDDFPVWERGRTLARSPPPRPGRSILKSPSRQRSSSTESGDHRKVTSEHVHGGRAKVTFAPQPPSHREQREAEQREAEQPREEGRLRDRNIDTQGGFPARTVRYGRNDERSSHEDNGFPPYPAA